MLTVNLILIMCKSNIVNVPNIGVKSVYALNINFKLLKQFCF